MRTRFALPCPDDPLALSRSQQVELLGCDMNSPSEPCVIDLKWGFFFDGTNNNRQDDQPKLSHSNIARLYDIFEVDRKKPELAARYAAGVGTPFKNEVGDHGLGVQQKAGLAAGWGGEARICWALLKFLDNLHYYFETVDLGESLGEADATTIRRMAADIKIPALQLRKIAGDETEMLRQVGMMAGIQTLTATGLNPPDHNGRRNVLRERREQLTQRVERWRKAQPKPNIRSIRVSVFGFSRGAAEARVFCSWLKDACDSPGGDLSLCGIPVQLDFLGIFDTVASVGMAKSSMIFDGHGGYADEDDLRIAPYVRRCVHLVAAHEVRGSFPLDTAYGVNGEEVVYPGVHSDLGGGYEPGEQGKGFIGGSKDDSAKLSQIPLCHMYREAVAEGVPLNLSKPGLPQRVKDAFKVDKGLIAAFNGYVEATKDIKASSTIALMQAHYGLYLRWRRLRLGREQPQGLTHQPFIARARTLKQQDVTDLLQANHELRLELDGLLEDEKDPAYRTDNVLTTALRAALPLVSLRDATVRAVWGEKMAQWREVKPHWHNTTPLDARIIALYDDYLHDSRAWFKPFGAASEQAWLRDYSDRMKRLEAQDARYQEWERSTQRLLEQARQQVLKNPGVPVPAPLPPPRPTPVSGNDLEDMKAWRKNPGVVPDEMSGREPYALYGYLRWRTTFVVEKSWLQQGKEAIDEKVEDLKQLRDRGVEAAGEVVEDTVDRGLNAGKDYLIDQAKKLIPSGLPRL